MDKSHLASSSFSASHKAEGKVTVSALLFAFESKPELRVPSVKLFICTYVT